MKRLSSIKKMGVWWMLLLISAVALTAKTHTVKRGETLSGIADTYGLSVRELAQINHLKDKDLVKVGQKLEVPDGQGSFSGTYQVRRGDSLTSVAKAYGVSVSDLARQNGLSSKAFLKVGQRLKVPGAVASADAGEYTIKKGDSLAEIAARFGVSASALARSNHISNPNKILPGQVLRIPGGAVRHYPELPSSVARKITAVKVSPNWKYIVIHHSATTVGTGKGMDRYHREERHMKNGLAYHFVIGNGKGMGDGEVFVGQRWLKQLEGGHLSKQKLNQVSIGICLVGNIEKRPPTKRQLDALEALVRCLLDESGLDVDDVTTHKRIQPNHTLCPGKRFDYQGFIGRLRG